MVVVVVVVADVVLRGRGVVHIAAGRHRYDLQGRSKDIAASCW